MVDGYSASNSWSDDYPAMDDLSKSFDKLCEEWSEDILRATVGLPPKDRSQQRHSNGSQYKQSVFSDDPQVRWLQHLDRMRRGKRLTGGGTEIDEERS